MQTVRERLRQGGRPVNHDLQRAVRKAYLQATLALIDARLQELGVKPSLLQRDIRYLFRQPPEPKQLLTVRSAIQRELKQLPNAAYIPPSSEAEQQVDLLLQPRGETAQQRTGELKASLKAQLLQELRERWSVQPSERLQEMLQSGWQETTEQGETLTLDWFDLLCAFFAEELKQNERVSTILQSQLLANLSVEGVSVDYSAFIQQLEQFGGQALQRLQQIEQTLMQLRQEQAEGFQAVEQRLDEYLPTLLTRTAQIQELMQALQAGARRRALYEQYAGLELALRTERVIRDYTTLFVGREAELEQLDALFGQPSGMLLISAPAGYGKTALLANWTTLRHEAGCFIACHFFRQEYDDANRLDSLPKALYNLLRQLYIYYGLEQESPPRDEGLLRDALLGLLRERGARADEPLVLLLDALDEAEQRLLLTLPEPLPEGVYVVASTRAGEGETPDALQWLHGAQRLHLQSLPLAAIADYLTRADDGELAPYAQQADFVALLRQKTDGYPLHLRFLVDDLLAEARRGGDVRAVLERTPKGFDNYVREQLRRLARSLTNAPKVQQLFALLATAHGALSERELETLTGLNAFELAELPWQATRWFSAQEQGGERHYAFTHPALGDAFERALGSMAQGARQQLLDYCKHWAEHKSAYALRYYPAHLKEAGDYEALYALARDEAFALAQREALPAEADLPMRTLQTALQAAIEQENAPLMAEMLLRHATLALRMETPLDALQQGNLERAIGLTKPILERDYKVGTLWLLLLAWNRQRADETEQAERCLKEIQAWWEGKILERLEGWESEAGALLMSLLGGLSTAPVVAVQILGDGGRTGLALRWAQLGQIEQALAVAWRIERAAYRSWVLAQMGQLEQALEIAQHIEGTSERSYALVLIVETLAAVGQFNQALELAQQIEVAKYRSQVLARTVQALTHAGLMEQALAVTSQIEEPAIRFEALVEIVQAFARMGRLEQAQTMLYHALLTAQAIEEATNRTEMLARAAIEFVRAGQFELAITTAQQVEESNDCVSVLSKIVRTLALSGQVEQAIEVVQHVEEIATRTETLVRVVQELVQLRRLELALKIAQQIVETSGRSQALAPIAQALATEGRFDQALEVAQQIEEISTRSGVLAGIVAGLVSTGQVARALEIAQQIAGAGNRLLATLAIAAGRAGQADNFVSIEQAVLHDKMMVDAVQELLQIGQFEWALEAALQIQDAYDRSRALEKIALALAHAEQFEQALEIAQQMAGSDDRSEVLLGIARILVLTERFEQAQMVLRDALLTTQHFEGVYSRSRASARIERALTQAKQLPPASDVAQQTEEALEETTEASVQVARIEQNLEIARQIEKADLRCDVLIEIALVLAHADQQEQAQSVLRDALQAAQQIEEAYYRSRALAEIAQAFAQIGEFEHALRTAQQIEKANHRSRALAGVAQALARAGRIERAKVVLQAAWQAAQIARSLESLWQVAIAAAQADLCDLAVLYAQQIAGNRVRGLPAVLDALTERGAKAALLQLLPLCGWARETALHACACLMRFYPDDAPAIAEQAQAWA